MADQTAAADLLPAPTPPPITTAIAAGGDGLDSALPIRPLDDAFFTQYDNNGNSSGDNSQNDVVIFDDLDFDFSFDDLYVSSSELDDLVNPLSYPTHPQPGSMEPESRVNPSLTQPNFDQLHPELCLKSTSPELRHLSGTDVNAGEISSDHSSNNSRVLNSGSPGSDSCQISGYLNVSSPESNGSNTRSLEDENVCMVGADCASPESENCGSNVSEDSNNFTAGGSVNSLLDSVNSSVKIGVIDQTIKVEALVNDNVNCSLLKRKKEMDDPTNNNVESRTSKYRKSSSVIENGGNNGNNNNSGLSGEDEKRKARLMRNRESAQLSRQRKKHYVEELEDKVRSMHSMIQDLNSKISYVMTENVTLRQQLGGGGGAAVVPPPPMVPPPPGMYPHPAMVYPWMPCAPPYMMKPQGSQVPLVPIPKLKTQQPATAPKVNKKAEGKKSELPKTKKVAGVSFLGLLFFLMLFGGLAPMVNVRYGGVREAFTGGESYVAGGFYGSNHGRILMVNGTDYGKKAGGVRDFSNNSIPCGQSGPGAGGEPPVMDETVRMGNKSEPLVASLYVPRNDKLVKIDGNLIIHSVLASEKAMASREDRITKTNSETGLVPAIPVPGGGRNGGRNPHMRALGSTDKDNMKSMAADGRLQEWFREGLAGPMLSSGMCTEVFQFDISASGAIIPAPARSNVSAEQIQNSTELSKVKNRRILHGLPIPLPGTSPNISKKHGAKNSQEEHLNRNKSVSSMVVSVLVDPREVGDADGDGVMGPKSLSKIFVVVLIDSVKYVTYSCMLPFKGSILS